MIKVLLILLSLLLIFPENIESQENSRKFKITGTVLDQSRKPVINAVVMIDGQKTGSATDRKGEYRIRVSRQASRLAILSFHVGFIEQEISERTIIDFNFSKTSDEVNSIDIPPGEEYINMGYNYVKKKNISNSVASIDFKNSRKTYSSVYEMIRELPGVWVNGNSIVLPGSMNLWGFVGPVVIVDGIRRYDLYNIPPTSVESITLLKDASSAIYGTEGFGGALIITTRKTMFDRK